MSFSMSISPNQAWLTVFLPALLYYTVLSPTTTPILSYLNLLPPYTPIGTIVRLHDGTPEEVYNHILYNGARYKYSFEYVINSTDDGEDGTETAFYDMTWVEDEELGRGYLLVSDASQSGKVWRYETGGGIIPIGTSLYLDQSGCRSDGNDRCISGNNGSRGMAVQVIKDESRFDIGNLLIVEHGERRIVRMEQDGARTPLVLNAPSLCENDNHADGNRNANERLSVSAHAGKLIYTPFGDLFFTGTIGCGGSASAGANASESTSQSALYRLREVVNIPPIPFRKSRDAHTWEMEDLIQYHQGQTQNQKNNKALDAVFSVEVAFHGMSHISDVVVGKDMTSIFIAGRIEDRYMIVKTVDDSDGDHDGDEDDDDDGGVGGVGKSDSGSSSSWKKNLKGMPIFFDMTDFFSSSSSSCPKNDLHPLNECDIALTLDASGKMFATYPGGIAIIDAEGDLLATVSLQDEDELDSVIVPTSIVIGNDGYLYVSSRTALLRYKIKSKLLDYPTNLIVPKKK